MIRGTTPTFTFTLPFECSELTLGKITFSQADTVVVEKDLADCTTSGKVLTCTLTEEETLLFNCHLLDAEIQIRAGCGTSRLASEIMTVSVGRILKDGCLAPQEPEGGGDDGD